MKHLCPGGQQDYSFRSICIAADLVLSLDWVLFLTSASSFISSLNSARISVYIAATTVTDFGSALYLPFPMRIFFLLQNLTTALTNNRSSSLDASLNSKVEIFIHGSWSRPEYPSSVPTTNLSLRQQIQFVSSDKRATLGQLCLTSPNPFLATDFKPSSLFKNYDNVKSVFSFIAFIAWVTSSTCFFWLSGS